MNISALRIIIERLLLLRLKTCTEDNKCHWDQEEIFTERFFLTKRSFHVPPTLRNIPEEQRSLKAGDLSHQESNNIAASTMKLQSDSFSSEKII
ncbi:hypothetical protein E2986_11274 [Frieseomelitta varia]|uniref:Uncharacterized protein n=1 Tax=Frieseomelitta varia TaxID=561572 RepID=A0A833S8E9_9HYME|nr:hypothetical protein E2986_11274 [Frieseomelitta varia]